MILHIIFKFLFLLYRETVPRKSEITSLYFVSSESNYWSNEMQYVIYILQVLPSKFAD